MLDMLSYDAGSRVEALRAFGILLDVSGSSASVARYGITPSLAGTGLTVPLLSYGREKGVQIIEGAMVIELLTDDNRCTGARVLDTRTGRLYSLGSRATIIATGGAGRLYGRIDNPVRTTGDGFALLAEMGVPFVDMKFVQF